MSLLAVTGGTGFVGRHLIRLATGAGHRVRALARRSPEPMPGVEWAEGTLADPGGLEALCRGADAVIHIAGAINAPDAAGFEAVNVTGTANMVAAAKAAGVRRFVHVSSLAAREPSLSAYGASKARSEQVVASSGLEWDAVRPPAVYGPGDREMLELFRVARHGVVPLPPGGRLSLIHVEDLARLLLALAAAPARGAVYEPDDGRPRPQRELADLLAVALGRRVQAVAVPKGVLRVAAAMDRLVRGKAAKLTADRVAYFCHSDWTVSPAARPPGELWRPQVAAEDGFATTADWYRRERWL